MILVLGLLLPACTRSEPDDGKIHLTYWEKWERFERDAMMEVVNAFNNSQNQIEVHYVAIGGIDRKILIATAGGDPPDVCGFWEGQVATFADKGILTPLDDLMRRDGLSPQDWIPVYRGICTHRGRMWAIPTTPFTTALHWNKALFREAGLDPERPPRTLAELDEYARRLTRYDAQGNITQMGFIPFDPVHSWFVWAFPYWFGGDLMRDGQITANDPLNIEALEWVQKYSLEYGADRIKRFSSGFGNFASPQNPFFSGKLAMIFQGVWMNNFISQYSPGLQWGAAPWPKTPHGPEKFGTAGTDVMAIPVGVPQARREAAWTFLKFVASQRSMETLNRGQRKNTPLNRVSDDFVHQHPHPYIQVFIDLSHSPAIRPPLQVGIWTQYQKELTTAIEQMRVLEINKATQKPFTPREALDIVQQRMTLVYERLQASMARREASEK